jgi:hypothetical protein
MAQLFVVRFDREDDYRRRKVGFGAEAGERSGEYSGDQVGFNRQGRWARRAPSWGESDYQGSGRFGFRRQQDHREEEKAA